MIAFGLSTNDTCSAGTDLHQLNYERLTSLAPQTLYFDAEVENSLWDGRFDGRRLKSQP